MSTPASPGPTGRPTPEAVLTDASTVLDTPVHRDLSAELDALDQLQRRLAQALATADRV